MSIFEEYGTFKVDTFIEERQNKFEIVACPETVSASFKICLTLCHVSNIVTINKHWYNRLVKYAFRSVEKLYALLFLGSKMPTAAVLFRGSKNNC